MDSTLLCHGAAGVLSGGGEPQGDLRCGGPPAGYQPDRPHAASLSGQRQLSAALRARDAVAGALDAAAGGFGLDAVSVCVDDALAALCDLTGENASEAVIEQVFERFCVGK